MSKLPSNSSTPPPRHDAYSAFREPAFRNYMAGNLIIQFGTGAQSVAIAWEIYARTQSPTALGLVGLVQAVPMLLFTLPAGYLADVMDRKRLMILGMIGTSLTSLALAVYSYLAGSIAIMYLLLFLDSAALRLTGPARTAFVSQLVPLPKLENAMKWRSTLGQVGAVVGPGLGGFVVAWNVPMAYVFSALSTTLFIFVLLMIRIPDMPRAVPGNMIDQVIEGVQFVWRRKVLLGTISLDLFAVLLGGASFVLPIYVTSIINLEGTGLSAEQALGWLKAAPAFGALLMALWLAHAPPICKAGRTMLWSVAGFGAAIIVFGFSRNFWLSLSMFFLTGVFDTVSVIVRHTLVQLLTPNELRGRVSAVNSIFIGSSNELGGFRAGAVAGLIGPVASVITGGFCTLLVVGAWAGLFPNLRRFGSLADASSQEEDQPKAAVVSSPLLKRCKTPTA